MIKTPQALLRTAHTYWQGCRQGWFRRDSVTPCPNNEKVAATGGNQREGAGTASRSADHFPETPPNPTTSRGAGDLRGLDPADVDYFQRGSAENPEFWWRLVDRPQFSGKHVLDVGCGLGSLCVDMASAGAARVVGLDTESKLIAFARQHSAQAFPDLLPVLEFYDEDLARFNQGKFDIIVSKDSFEHIMDLDGMLRAMASHLKPGGRIYSGFGPLYKSPFGHHGRVATLVPWRQFPWAHLWESEAKIVRRLNRLRARGEPVFTYTDAPLKSIRDLGLSMYSLADYRRLIFGSGLKVVRFEVNRSKHALSRVLSVLRRLSFLEEYCTHNIYCILEKPL